MAIEENFDLSELKVVDDSGEAQPVVLNEEPEKEVVEGETQEPETPETEVENTSEEETEVKETVSEETEDQPAEEVSEEEQVESNENVGKPDELFQQLDDISKQLSDGKANTLEEFFEEYKRMRDSSETQFKDDYIKSAVEYYNANGSLTPYLEATSVNYSEMSDEQIMRHNLIKSNPSLSQRNIERLFQRDVVNKYTLDEDRFDEDEVELGKELLKVDAERLRNQFVD